MKLASVIVFAVIVFTLIPFALIGSLNTLFALGIPYTFGTWISALFIALLVGSSNAR